MKKNFDYDFFCFWNLTPYFSMFVDLIFAVLLFEVLSRNVTTANSEGRLYIVI